MFKYLRLKELLITTDYDRFMHICGSLTDKNIEYTTEISNPGLFNRLVGTADGRGGVKPQTGTLYYIYTTKDEYSRHEGDIRDILSRVQP